MSDRTVVWDHDDAGEQLGLREQKKRRMRRLLSDTATELFVERGFAAVQVAEIARVCGVSEKTVFNYFPSKEALLLDRGDATEAGLRRALADHTTPAAAAVATMLDRELGRLTDWIAAQPDERAAYDKTARFGALIAETPSLRAHQREQQDALVALAAESLAARYGFEAADPEPQIAATALVGLTDIQAVALRRELAARTPVAHLRAAVAADVTRAATVVAGLEASLRAR
ncbi:TetR/AcrR family transcriptional regulator [Leifsonia sp. Le1]|uniref:TetR/AcrR family transcriptional regulator n=1 Tax=Leifsonia sp. Le1 TaxID=3404918 RepID=UPI003EB74CF0